MKLPSKNFPLSNNTYLRDTVSENVFLQVKRDNKEPRFATDASTTVGNSIYELVREDNDPSYRYRSVNHLDRLAADSLKKS